MHSTFGIALTLALFSLSQLGGSAIAQNHTDSALPILTSETEGGKMATATKESKKTSTKNKLEDAIDEWWPESKGQFEIGLDNKEKHSGTRSAYIRSVVARTTEFGNLTQAFVPNNYLGKRIKLSAWVKSRITSGTANLWIRVDGEWNNDTTKPGCFDNMDDRPSLATLTGPSTVS